MVFRKLLPFLFLAFSANAWSQFYNGLNQTFGKNRVQYEDFFWTYYRFPIYEYHFYPEGRKAANFAAKTTPSIVDEQQKFFDYYLSNKIYFLVYTDISDFRQSNIGINDEENGLGGVTHVSGNKVFLFFNGDYESFENQIKKGVASIMVNQMMFGENWKEVLKNSALLSIPDWYIKGLVSYASNPWNVEMDNYLRDAVISEKFQKFNRLSKRDAEIAGHSLWNYIAEVYGKNVIPNVLYMARVSKNIESGFLFVLGVSLNELVDESLLYYKVRYETEDETSTDPQITPEPIKIKKNRIYDQWVVNATASHGAFTTNKLGKSKVYLYDREKGKKGKKQKIYRRGYKLDRINDYKQPILLWHPDGDKLAIITETKGKPMLGFYNLNDKELIWREIFKVDKVYDASFSTSGDYLVMTGVQKGQSDIYTLKLSSNVIEQVTNDIFDDKQPRFVQGDSKIIFSSNRQTDTLSSSAREDAYNKKVDNWDVFLINYQSKKPELKRLSNTDEVDEIYPSQIDKYVYTWVSDENGVFNRYLVTQDSVIASIDTTINYRYVTNTQPLTNYRRNIAKQYFPVNSPYFSQAMFIDRKYKMFVLEKDLNIQPLDYELDNTKFRESVIKANSKQEQGDVKPKAEAEKPKLIYTRVKVFEENQEESTIDIDNYQFGDEKPKDDSKSQSEETPNNSRFITLKSKSSTIKNDEVVLPQQRNYFLNFVASDVISTVDFDFANQIYQPFNGGPWTNPGMGAVLKVELYDLFEDYKVEGGMRYSFNSDNKEFFASLEDRTRRLDRKYSLQRQAITSIGNFSAAKTIIHQAKLDLNFPFNEVIALRSTFNFRNDRNIALSTDRRSLQEPDTYINWVGGKFELVFDNIIDKGLNLQHGMRWKIFFERYQEINDLNTDINIAGLDFRVYQKIHRDMIWAFRVAGSTSFGNRKLAYYLGGVDNWFVLNQDNERFNFDTRIANDQNYYFQAIATNMRGFQQNIRNGNSFTAINNEIRWPIFKYFANKPIKSEFWGNFQLIGFTDVGTAWTGRNPFSDENTFNTVEIIDGPITVRLDNKKNPIVGAYGFGLRSKLWGYFGRFDYAWGIEDGEILDPRIHLSFGLDF